MRFVDSHCHLDFPDYQDDLDAVMARAAAAGVTSMLTISTHVSRFSRVLAVAEALPAVVCTVGVHPHEAAREEGVTVDRLVDLSGHPKVVGFGETGLDYYYEHSPRAAQQASFRIHLQAARRAGLPVVVHTRDADEDTAAILREAAAEGPLSGVLHCFSSGEALARTAIDLGFYISFSGIITFKKADALRRIAAALPRDRILIETDAPYLAPVPHRGRRNEPAYVTETARVLAAARGEELAALAAATTENFFRLFAKAPPCA
ncbi:MAG: TatD family hydrolase [Rhodospirillales bacterium]|nr:TatD family hydrolase [Rhodospirillales bacterium]